MLVQLDCTFQRSFYHLWGVFDHLTYCFFSGTSIMLLLWFITNFLAIELEVGEGEVNALCDCLDHRSATFI